MSCWSLVLCSYIQQYGQEHLEWILLLVQYSCTFYTRPQGCVLGSPALVIFEVKTIDGDADIKVPAGVENSPFLNPKMEAWKDDLPFQLGDFQAKHVNFLGCGWSWKLQLRNFWVETQWDWLGTNDLFSVNWICNLMTNHDEPNQDIFHKKNIGIGIDQKPTHQYTRVKIDGCLLPCIGLYMPIVNLPFGDG